MRRAYPYRGENSGPGKDIVGELDTGYNGSAVQAGTLPTLPIAVLRAPQHDCCASRPEPPYFSANFIVATGQLPSWLPIEIRRPWSSSSQSLSTVPAFPLVKITALPTSSV